MMIREKIKILLLQNYMEEKKELIRKLEKIPRSSRLYQDIKNQLEEIERKINFLSLIPVRK